MIQPAITGSGVFTPESTITNAELVVAFNAYADRVNAENAAAIAAGTANPVPHSSADFILSASAIAQRHVMDKTGVLDPARLFPTLPARDDDSPSLMADIAVDAVAKALAQAGRRASHVALRLCGSSNP